ncbi:hypothetical protein G4Y73_05835 [Wenzhouxiangella sp. XN201]|uniref:hypothetical protein n=1 Tax=Wenzhouxiangella sp. XN201 TaxID=2710755 RepID=UPI0013C821C9|nr:hypothetical protein [Wenzhouxiangella sp. XN201]NEZ03674.1 hypothetical protein [Wenzhouxiangella sp. XN201]
MNPKCKVVPLPLLALAGLLCITLDAVSQASGNCDWVGGTDNSWHTAANWNCDQHNNTPGATDAVVIAPGGTVEVQVAAAADAWSLELGIDDGSSPHPEDHQLVTTVDDVTLTIGEGGVTVRQTGYMLLGQGEVSGGIGSQPALRANLASAGTVLVHGRLFPRNATITANVVLDEPAIGGARGALQARGWNVIHGQLHVVSGFLQPVVPAGFYGSGAPHLLVVDNDLIVENGSSVQLFADPGPITEAAIAVDGGVFDLRGGLTTSSFSSAYAMPFEIDAVLVNTGVMRSRLSRPPGLRFSGPEGAVHQNSGTIEVGALLSSDTENDAVDGFGLVVEPGRSLHNTGQITIHRLRSAEGAVANTDGGVIVDASEVAGPDTFTLGFAGPQAVEIEVTNAGTIERLHMTWHGEDHADAALETSIAGTNYWWELAATTADDNPASGELALSLPRLNPNVPRVCRHQESPPAWDCLPTTFDAGHATVTGLTTLSAWAVADLLDAVFHDRFEATTP